MITRTRRTLVALAAAAVLAMGLASCAGAPSPEQAAMQEYVEAERSQIPAILDASGGVYKTMMVEAARPDTIEFSYTHANQLDAATVSVEFDKVASQFREVWDDQRIHGMRAYVIQGAVNVSCIYLDLDGSEMWHKDLTCS